MPFGTDKAGKWISPIEIVFVCSIRIFRFLISKRLPQPVTVKKRLNTNEYRRVEDSQVKTVEVFHVEHSPFTQGLSFFAILLRPFDMFRTGFLR
jgi:hypothetical protein